MFAYDTRNVGGPLRNQILRYRNDGGAGALDRIIFSSPTYSGAEHDGGRILFGPDGTLYAIVGDRHEAANAQDLSNRAGKILRMRSNGDRPWHNPFKRSLVWAYGIRNSFGFTFDPLTGRLWETDAGPSCNDEINLIRKGRNYGWGPSQTCSTPPPRPAGTNRDGPNPVLPVAWFNPPNTPVGIAFCRSCGLRGSEGDLFFGGYNDGKVHRIVLNANRDDIASMSVVYTHSDRILSMERAPDGRLYISDPHGIYRVASA